CAAPSPHKKWIAVQRSGDGWRRAAGGRTGPCREIVGRSRATLIALAVGLVSTRGLYGDSLDPVEAARRLQQRAASIQPLPDSGSGITRDVGSIAVIEHDGSNYDAKDPDGVPNYSARAPVGQR